MDSTLSAVCIWCVWGLYYNFTTFHVFGEIINNQGIDLERAYLSKTIIHWFTRRWLRQLVFLVHRWSNREICLWYWALVIRGFLEIGKSGHFPGIFVHVRLMFFTKRFLMQKWRICQFAWLIQRSLLLFTMKTRQNGKVILKGKFWSLVGELEIWGLL